MARIAVAALLALSEDVPDRRDEERQAIQEVNRHLHADDSRRVDTGVDVLARILDNDDLAAGCETDRRFFGRNTHPVEPIKALSALGFAGAVVAISVVVKGEVHRS